MWLTSINVLCELKKKSNILLPLLLISFTDIRTSVSGLQLPVKIQQLSGAFQGVLAPNWDCGGTQLHELRD